ncbi:MAG: hypothetical protein ACLPYB_11060 [Desulfobaccales bacterium]
MHPDSHLALSDGSLLTAPEHFVLKQAAAGEIADLQQEFGGGEEERRLRAGFLEELLCGDLPGVRLHRRGVRISRAVIAEPLHLENGEVAVAVALRDCVFKESFSIKRACFKHHLSLIGSHFLERAVFYRLNLAGDLFCGNTVFAGPVNFFAAQIDGEFDAEGAKFLAEDQKADFYGMRVGQNASFAGVEFHGPVDLGGAEIMGHFRAPGAKFLGANHKANFAGMQVGRDAFFQACDFQGLVSFITIKIAGDFHLEPLLLKIGQEMSTTFNSGVNLRGAEIGGEFSADKVQFLGHISDFEAVQVGRGFHANGAIFAGSAYFTEMAVKNNFYLDPFGRLKVFKTLFKGPADFSRLEVGGVFNADQAIFKSESTIFSGLKVGLGAFFNGTIFFGGLVLKEGQLNDLEIRGLHPLSVGGLPLAEIVLNRTRIAHRLTIADIEVKRFEARKLQVEGPAELLRLAIKDKADWRGASLDHLQLAETGWPDSEDGQQRVDLAGLTFQSLTTRSDRHPAEEWQALLDWLGGSRFDTHNYSQMDDFFQRRGLRKWADRAFIAGKRRKLAELPWWRPGRWLAKVFWDGLAGFGRKPGRILWTALALVLLGWLLFHPAGQPFWIGLAASLDRFLPGADLGVARAFQPAGPSNYVWAYWHLEKIMGWVLAPIALAAIYTRIKNRS